MKTEVDGVPRPDVRAVYTIKCVSLSMGLVLGWLLHFFLSPQPHILQITLIFFVVLLPSLLVVFWSGKVPRWLLRVTFAVDVLAVTSGVHFAGGRDSVSGPMLYIVFIGI